MAYSVMHVYVNGIKFRTFGGNHNIVKKECEWHNKSTYKELSKKYKWLKEGDVITSDFYNKRNK